jgi:hypothetical protein
MTSILAQAVIEALDALPCSDRNVALRANVPPSTITRIRKGEVGASPAVAQAILDAAGDMKAGCTEAERTLRRALRRHEKGGTK